MSSLFERLRVVDSHLHLVTPAVSYRPAVEALLSSCTARLGKPPCEISERDFVEAAQAPYLKACVFVEVPRPSFRLLAHSLTLMTHGHQVRLGCGGCQVCPTAESSIDEACWVLDMIQDPSSLVGALVASIPVPEGVRTVPHNTLRTHLFPDSVFCLEVHRLPCFRASSVCAG
jgi:hypothetical protein